MSAHSVSLPRKILVAVDAGTQSDHAINVALDLAQRFDAHVEIVHAFGAPAMLWNVVPDPMAVAAGTDVLSRARDHVVAHVADLLGPARGGRARAEELVRVVAGRPDKVILERAREMQAELIVLGALRSRPRIEFGSTARSVLARAHCPVWVQTGPGAPIGRILVPVDLSEESFLALAKACDLALTLRATVSAIHAFDMVRIAAVPWEAYGAFPDLEPLRKSSYEEFEQAMRGFEWKGVGHDVQFVDGRPADEILERAQRADLIVMGTHGRTGIASALIGSVVYEVLERTTRPVMVVRKPGRKFET